MSTTQEVWVVLRSRITSTKLLISLAAGVFVGGLLAMPLAALLSYFGLGPGYVVVEVMLLALAVTVMTLSYLMFGSRRDA